MSRLDIEEEKRNLIWSSNTVSSLDNNSENKILVSKTWSHFHEPKKYDYFYDGLSQKSAQTKTPDYIYHSGEEFPKIDLTSSELSEATEATETKSTISNILSGQSNDTICSNNSSNSFVKPRVRISEDIPKIIPYLSNASDDLVPSLNNIRSRFQKTKIPSVSSSILKNPVLQTEQERFIPPKRNSVSIVKCQEGKISRCDLDCHTIVGSILAIVSALCGILALKDLKFCICHDKICTSCDYENIKITNSVGHTFKECSFSNAELENATVIDSKLEKVTMGNDSQLISSTCDSCSIRSSKILEGSILKDSTIIYSNLEDCKVIESMLYYTNITSSHLLESNVYRGNCKKCQLQSSKIVDHYGYNSYVIESELAENSFCHRCCVYNSHIHSVILKDSVYFSVTGAENKTQLVNSRYSGLAMVCPTFSEAEIRIVAQEEQQEIDESSLPENCDESEDAKL